jgi:maltose alpha-D-glucosyltransferase / alpha-amylase
LDLHQCAGMVPMELFGQSEFPAVGEEPYFLTLGPHAFYWFSLDAPRQDPLSSETSPAAMLVPSLAMRGEWHDLLNRDTRDVFSGVLTGYIRNRRWFGGKARYIRGLHIQDVVPLEQGDCNARILLLEVEYAEGEPETYILPIAFAEGEQAEQIINDIPYAVIARLEPTGRAASGLSGVLYDAMYAPEFNRLLLESIASRRRFRGERGEILALPGRAFRRVAGRDWSSAGPVPLRVEQSNTSVAYGDRLMLKLFRRVEEGLNPDLELGRFLTERAAFPHVPQVAGALEYQRRRNQEPMTLATLQGFVPNQGDAWSYTLDSLVPYFERALTYVGDPPIPHQSLLALSQGEITPLAQETNGPYLESARLLGQRTAELHQALASAHGDPAFAPEPFTDFYRRSLYQSLRNSTAQNLDLLRHRLHTLPEDTRDIALQVLDRRGDILDQFNRVISLRLSSSRIRCHGDYHLGQVLYNGSNFIIIDFEGEPARPITERRLKRCPLRDVAGMVRSFHYAPNAALAGQANLLIRPEDRPVLEKWGQFWYHWTAAAFLKSYLEVMSQVTLLPRKPEELQVLLDIYLLEKAIYEIGYELNSRPDWVRVPLEGIMQLLDRPE